MNPIERDIETKKFRAQQSVFTPDPTQVNKGVTMRDYFAAAALQGMLANPNHMLPKSPDNVEAFAQMAFTIADAMLQEKYK